MSTTPCSIGADPATTALLGSSLRPLGGPEETARQLMRSPDRARAGRALLHRHAVSDIVSGNRPSVGNGDTMTHMQDLWRGSFQDAALRDLVDDIDRRAETGSGYTESDHAAVAIVIPPTGPAEARYGDDAALDEIHFAWAGSSVAGEPHYCRLHGPRLLVEYDNTQRQANHAHSVWRDPGSDFGLDVLAEHRHHSPHSG